MATYFQSLNIGNISADTSNVATVSGRFTTSDGGTTVNTPYDFSLVELDSTGNQVGTFSAFTSSSVRADGSFTITYNATDFPIPSGNSIEVVTDDTQNHTAITSAPFQTTSNIGFATNSGSNNTPSNADPALQTFASQASAKFSGAPVDVIGSTAQTYSGHIGVISPGSDVALTVTQDAYLFASGGAVLDLSNSPATEGDGSAVRIHVGLGSGDNTVTMGPFGSVHSTTGNDTLKSSGGHDALFGGSGSDSITGGGQSLIVGGSGFGDTLVGGTSDTSHDTIYAGAGGALISTSTGQNTIYGQTNDTIDAGSAQDTVTAGLGAETITGGFGSVVYGGGQSVMQDGYDNTYKATGADTIYGSDHDNTVVIQGQTDGVVVDGRTGHGALDVTLQSTNQGNDTLFGGTNADGTGSNLTIHVSQAFTEQQDLDQNGLHVVQLAGGQTLHVTNVTIDFQDKKTYV